MQLHIIHKLSCVSQYRTPLFLTAFASSVQKAAAYTMGVAECVPKTIHFSHICTPQRSKIACGILSTYGLLI